MIYLIGFMGSGKSTIAKQLSEELHKEYIEMDEEIEKKEGATIPQMFSDHGESYFREKETLFLKSIKGDEIVSTGGGIILADENRDLLAEGTVFYLQASWETIVERLADDTERPLWKGEIAEKKARLEERLPLYESLADYIIPVDGKTPGVITDEIVKCLK
ncbi:shikimate kinase [Halobacillus litoralis]|uniref:Shikimate kinase n=1 Tax=Halobacillus litoralis TaxID=45668 RepID=A0A410MHP8_9BACI|nr:shikimate kinase [Halobacillus litoralis]QAS54208.1 shikimate kinase [Halobacillus litoralis]